jgi:hypothetical protein
VFHLHPALVAAGDLRQTLPSMPPGEYRLYGDIVHANGFPETLTASLIVPPGLPSTPLAPDDASAMPPGLAKGDLGTTYKLPDGYSMVWERPANLTANTAYAFRFRLLDANGRPATNMQPYLGMAGHAAFVKADGSTFAHTHPNGSAAMAAVMLANGESPTEMGAMSGMEMGSGGAGNSAEPIAPSVDFPYGFPAAGRYRIFLQMKHDDTVAVGRFILRTGTSQSQRAFADTPRPPPGDDRGSAPIHPISPKKIMRRDAKPAVRTISFVRPKTAASLGTQTPCGSSRLQTERRSPCRGC